jgi:hypothetical protein
MIRLLAAAIALSCLSTPASTQSQPSPPAAGEQTTKPLIKAAARKPVARKESPGKPAPAGSEPCGLGVLVAAGDEFMVKKIGLYTDHVKMVPIESWGLDDLVFARVRVAAPRGVTVRRIPYSKSLQPSEELKNRFFRDRGAEQVDVMRQATAGTNCERYVLVGRSISKFRETNVTVRGIGIVDWDVPLAHKTYLFALAFIWVFDGRDFSIIRQGSAITHRDPLVQRMLLGELILGPHSELSQASFPRQPDDVPGNLALREFARTLLTSSLDKTLPWMLRQ